MSQRSGIIRFGSTLLLLLVILAGWSYYHMESSKRAALRTARELADCVQRAGEIKSLDKGPKRAQSSELAHTDLTRRIEAAAGASQIDLHSLSRIDAMPPRRLAKLPYEERSTRVTLNNVTMQQLVNFLYRLSNNTQDLRVKDLKLHAPRGEEVGDQWQADATLSYLIYTPPAPGSDPAP